jgi:hypothetical protein
MQTVVGLFERRVDAEEAVRRLQDAGFAADSIGVAMRDPEHAGELAAEAGVGDISAEAATAGALSGAGVGALVGLALVGSTLVLPGIGAILVGGSLATGAVTAAGTTAAALTGAGIGAASGGLIGGLVGAGIPEHEAREHFSSVERGDVLVTVQTTDDRAPRARQILAEEGARST